MERCHPKFSCLTGLVFVIGMSWILTIPNSLTWARQAADADVLVAQAVLAYEAQKYEDALNILHEALTLDPEDPRGLFYKGLVFLAENRPRLAIDPLEQALAIRPNDAYTFVTIWVWPI